MSSYTSQYIKDHPECREPEKLEIKKEREKYIKHPDYKTSQEEGFGKI